MVYNSREIINKNEFGLSIENENERGYRGSEIKIYFREHSVSWFSTRLRFSPAQLFMAKCVVTLAGTGSTRWCRVNVVRLSILSMVSERSRSWWPTLMGLEKILLDPILKPDSKLRFSDSKVNSYSNFWCLQYLSVSEWTNCSYVCFRKLSITRLAELWTFEIKTLMALNSKK